MALDAPFSSSPMRVIFPLILFALGSILEFWGGGKWVLPGVIITGFEILIIIQTTLTMIKIIPQKYKLLLLVPIGIGGGDLCYGLSNYAYKLNFPNQIGSLTYVFPYLVSMTIVAAFMTRYLLQISSKHAFLIFSVVGFPF